VLCVSWVSAALADVVTVLVGNPGNAGVVSGGMGGVGPERICGAVDYEYRIGKYEVTAGQYTEFLNAVAVTDTYGLYNSGMWSNIWGCKIQRSGSSGAYAYSVAGDWANRPVNFVSWGDAARFANWLHNGQPTGMQDLTTTEDGAYYLNGATSNSALMAVNREADWKWAITNEDEWYKAAYHKNDGATGNYFQYPTSSASRPSNDLINPDPGNNANFVQNDMTIDSPYFRTEGGEFENSASPYGTFDQAGNVFEWIEAIQSTTPSYRAVRGGSFMDTYQFLAVTYRNSGRSPATEDILVGFRVSAAVPEPSSMALLALGAVWMLRNRRNIR